MKDSFDKFIQANSPDGGFLQSEEWRKFQEGYGRKTFHIEQDGFWANVIEHRLKIVGKYFYVPRGPITGSNLQTSIHNPIMDLIELARQEKAGWIRVEPADAETLKQLIESTQYRVRKAPHDMQPREIFVIDVEKSEEELLSGMKSKTRYNLKIAQKKGIKTRSVAKGEEDKYFEDFLRLVGVTAQRSRISSHPEGYYRKMWETIPSQNLRLYVAEYEGKIITANLVLFYGKFTTYLHGASDNVYREVMAPYLLQWQSILDAKERNCAWYDFGGVSTGHQQSAINSKWEGITKFKSGFSPSTKSTEFPGAYDVVINKWKYAFYRLANWIK